MVFEFFTNFFANPFNLVMVALFILTGILIGLVFRPKAKNQVMKLIPRDRRFVDFNIQKENAFSLECEGVKGFPPQRFLKHAPGWTGSVGKFLKRMRTRYLGQEGTAYTWKTKSGTQKIGSLGKALRGLWGAEFYGQVPEDKRKELEDSKINVTVELEAGITPKDYKPVTEEAIKQEEDRLAAETWWKGKKIAEKGTWMQWMFIFMAGMGAMAIGSKLLGWW